MSTPSSGPTDRARPATSPATQGRSPSWPSTLRVASRWSGNGGWPRTTRLLEIPAGGLDIADDGSKEDPDLAAARELEEETGLRAGTWRKLGAFYSAPGFTDELMHLYIATELTPADPDGRLGPDEDERLILEWRPWQDAVSLAETGGIRDAKSIVGLFWLARVMEAEGLL